MGLVVGAVQDAPAGPATDEEADIDGGNATRQPQPVTPDRPVLRFASGRR